MTESAKKCPINKFEPCRTDCAWYDDEFDECAVMSINNSLIGIDNALSETEEEN